jgi:hypothetical protein
MFAQRNGHVHAERITSDDDITPIYLGCTMPKPAIQRCAFHQ